MIPRHRFIHTNLARPRLAHQRRELARSNEPRNVIEKATCLAFSKRDIVLHMSPCEYVGHHGHGYRVPAVVLHIFFRATPLNSAFLLVSCRCFLLPVMNNRRVRATLEKHNVLLAGDVGVVLGEKEKGDNKCHAERDDNAQVLLARQIL